MFKKNKEGKKGPVSVISAVVILAVAGVLFFTGGVKVEMGENDIVIGGTLSKKTISYSDITKLELRTELIKGTRTFGSDSIKTSSGSFKNTEFGSYKLYVYNAVSGYVVVYCGDDVTVFNMETMGETDAVYNSLRSKTGL